MSRNSTPIRMPMPMPTMAARMIAKSTLIAASVIISSFCFVDCTIRIVVSATKMRKQ